jgi:hypothetical protein
MTDERDPFLADQLGRITPPAHRLDFWADLEETLAMTSPTDADPSVSHPSHARDGNVIDLSRATEERAGRRLWQRPGLLAVAAALVLVVGIVAGVTLAGDDDPAGTAAGEATATVVEQPTAGPDEPTAQPTEPVGDQLDLTGAFEIGTSGDGALGLFAVPTTRELGCEGDASYELYWVDADGVGTVASPQLFFNVPEFAQGPGGQVTVLAGCEEQSSQLFVGIEDPAGSLGPLLVVDPVGWENAYVRTVTWGDSGRLIAEVSRMDQLATTLWNLVIDPVTGEVLLAKPATDAQCSASEITDVVFRPLDGTNFWTGLANAIQAAALSCDYDAVAALAANPFRYSFGDGDDFAGFLSDTEAAGDNPMAMLVRLLQVDPGTPPEDDTRLTWPAFFACESTCGIDTEEVLRLGYTQDDITAFEQFGGYIGYRMSFVQVPNADGTPLFEWQYFVAGD